MSDRNDPAAASAHGDAPAFTHAGDRRALEDWLAVTDWRIADRITMDDGSLLLHRAADPPGTSAWASVALGQTLTVESDGELRVTVAVTCLAAGISALMMGAATIHAELTDAEANRRVQDYARRAEMLTKAKATARKLATDAAVLEDKLLDET
ncbi:hypothetical protein SAMN05216251_12820 [Actinacidiphila alni]|uniref:Uncharacterized protein n=1 Tax=Actinacidiphila alni TaxID=380248 RepID=A0A1I2LHG8_9ACTN|nr:hypothetical protein [Actinacidiphila alni]SFF76897.1 hypothetical protein SAMN05216251_12820 [Actinacidiphila alni]